MVFCPSQEQNWALKKESLKEKFSTFDRHISKILIFSQNLGSKQPVFNFHKVQKSDRGEVLSFKAKRKPFFCNCYSLKLICVLLIRQKKLCTLDGTPKICPFAQCNFLPLWKDAQFEHPLTDTHTKAQPNNYVLNIHSACFSFYYVD